jgi:hypothetical protein
MQMLSINMMNENLYKVAMNLTIFPIPLKLQKHEKIEYQHNNQ